MLQVHGSMFEYSKITRKEYLSFVSNPTSDYTRSRITLTISFCTNMEKYAKYHSCNNIEKYANAVRVFYPDRIYREIREHNSRISLAQNI